LLGTSRDPHHTTTITTSDETNDITMTATMSSTSYAMMYDIYEKRAELYMELQQTDLALQDYQELLQLLQQEHQPPPSMSLQVPPFSLSESPSVTTSTTTINATNETNLSNSSTSSVTNLLRQATVHMSMGQLSNADAALQSYQNGKQCLHTALTLIQSSFESLSSESVSHPDHTYGHVDTTTASLPSLRDEIQQQYCRACCCIAELYLTDLCYSDNAEQLCEASLQESLSIIQTMSTESMTTNIHCIETYQMIASLRFSQKRNTEAHAYMKRVYEPMSVGCQALAILVGLRTKTETDDDTDNPHMAVELTALEHVQSLPPIEFRISTSKLLLECAGTLPYYADPNGATNDNPMDTHPVGVDDDDVRNGIATEQQQEYAVMAMDVIGSCLAEQDEMYECWILLGDAMIFLEKESAWSYWNRALQILRPIQQQLQHELLENDHNNDNMNENEENDPIQQQFDTIVMELDQLQERMDWAVRSGYDDDDDGGNGPSATHTTTTMSSTDGMEE
jgi:tetratricopeptide (TPR) repeat protein